MKKTLITLVLIFSMAVSFAQTPVRINIGDRQKITEFEVRNDSLVLSLENSGTNKVDLSGFAGYGLAQEAASTKILTKEDAGKIFGNASETDFTYTIPNQEDGNFTENVAYTFWVGSTGKIFVKGESGSGVSPREISTVEKYATIIRTGENEWRWGGTTIAWVPPVVNLYTLANAANPDNEADAITNASGAANWTVASASSSPAPSDGDYYLKWTHGGPDNTAYSGSITLTSLGLESGKTYEIRMDVSRIAGGNFTISIVTGSGWTSNVSEVITTTSDSEIGVWREIVLTGTRNENSDYAMLISANSNADTGNAIAVDNIRIYEVE